MFFSYSIFTKIFIHSSSWKLEIGIYFWSNYKMIHVILSFEMVSDGQYHIAELLAVKKNFTLRVDRGLARSIINEGTNEYLRLTTPMFLGGIPPEAWGKAVGDFHLRNLTSFHGTFKYNTFV